MSVTALILFVCATLPATADALKPVDAKWMRYENDQFGTVLDVPATFRPADPPPISGDGRQFRHEDGTTVLVYGSYSAQALMIAFDDYNQGLVERAKRNGLDASYQKSGKGWIVFSRQRNGRFVYTKVIDGCGTAQEFTIE